MQPTTHAHHWSTLSTHDTSDGSVGYQGCACGAQRIVATAAHTYVSLAEVDSNR